MPDTPVQDTEATLPLHINELTEGTVDGSGVFDVLMQAVKAHLRVEFDAGRIRATDYANVYTMSVGQVLAESTQYAVVKAKLDAELALINAQTEQVLQEVKTSAQQELLIAAQTSHTTKQELQTVQETQNLLSQDSQIKAQTKGIEAESAISEYQLLNILPVEKDNLLNTGLAIQAQTAQSKQQTTNLVTQDLQTKAQTKGIESQTALTDFQLTVVLPVELENLTKQGLQLDAQTGMVTKQTSSIDKQDNLTTAQTTLITKQTSSIANQDLQVAAQTKGIEKETEIKSYQLLNNLPLETANLTKQGLQLTAQTEQTTQQTDNLVSQNLLVLEQTKGLVTDTAIKDFQLLNILPTEMDNLVATGLGITAQTEQTTQQTDNLINQDLQTVEQTKSIKADTAIKDYQLINILPVELANLTLNGSALKAQTLQTTQQTSNLVTENLQVLEQTKGLKAETSIKEYQLTNILPVELTNLTSTGLGIVAQTDNVTQQTGNLLSQKTLAETQHELDMQAIEVQIGKTTADTVLVTKQCLLTEAQAVSESAQSTQLSAQTRQTDYVTSFQIPAQVAATEAQSELAVAQEEQVIQQTLNIVAERDHIVSQSDDIKATTAIKLVDKELKEFERDFAQPVNLELLGKEVMIKESQVALGNKELIVKQAQVDLANKDIALKQNQIELGTKELLIKEAQISVAEKEILLKAEQLLVAKYELATKLPAEVALTTSQADLYNQKKVTELAQVDSTPIKVGSVIDFNNKLIDEQGKSFLRSAQANSAKLLIDTWNVRHTADPDGNYADETNKLDDATIKKAVTALLQGINIPNV